MIASLMNLAIADENGRVVNIEDLSLEDLLTREVQVVSQKGESEHESPAVVSVVERREIVQSGARDLLDILQLVPGFTPTAEAGGTVTLGFRGHYGGLLILLD